MELESSYEISKVAGFIRSRGFTRVAIQFPDELLKDSMRVVNALRRELNSSSVKLYVMADTTYGNCCVDEVGAAHINAECVIHYGHTCLSKTSKIPALFVFGKASINISDCATNLISCEMESTKPVLVLYGLEYARAIPEVREALASNAHRSASMSEPPLYADICSAISDPSEESKLSDQLESDGFLDSNEGHGKGIGHSYKIGGLKWVIPEGQTMEDYLIFWIGLDTTAFANVVLTFNRCEIVRYDATDRCLVRDISQQNKVLKRRYYLVEKAKDANMIGILVGTLGAAGYLHIIHMMKELISKAGKKSYIFVMGKPNPAKLANFPECDVFIHVSCPQTALLDSKEFLAPIITPFEAVLAFERGSQWTGEYGMEFRDLISSSIPSAKKEQNEEARFSFLRGGYVEDLQVQDSEGVEKDEALALVSVTEKALKIRDGDHRVANKVQARTGAEYFASRSYHGLDIVVSDDTPGKVLTGRSGKASGYKEEIAQT